MEPDMLSPASQAEAIFSQGPETLVQAFYAIVAGAPARSTKKVDQQTTGAEPIPVTWTISGELENPIWLKGKPEARDGRGPFPFHRSERAMFAMTDSSVPDWELELGSVEQAAAVVLFYATRELRDPKVLPSPRGGPDFVQLVKDIVRIDSIAGPGRLQDWAAYASSAPSTEGRKAALRSLAASRAPWTLLEPTWLRQLRDPASPSELRTFALLLMVYCVTQHCWPRSQGDVVAIALATFAEERDPSLAFRFTDGLLMLHDAAQRDPLRFQWLEERVADVLRKRATLGTADDEHTRSLNEAYQEVRERVISRPAREPPAELRADFERRIDRPVADRIPQRGSDGQWRTPDGALVTFSGILSWKRSPQRDGQPYTAYYSAEERRYWVHLESRLGSSESWFGPFDFRP
jgi:hypothetical protein